MRWPRPRFTVRRLMIAIAILALGLGTGSWVARMRARSAAYWQRAVYFNVHTCMDGSSVKTTDGRWVFSCETENDRRQDKWARGMAAKYLRLSYYPWLNAELDPPPPRKRPFPRSARELPPPDDSDLRSLQRMHPPAWTFLWTWPPPGHATWE
jgi:hypothetical protein